jgi:cyclopropane fatty-acyl-phospholipid synthase-like methyltransferase
MLKADANILEIGAGPGQATEYFAKNDYCVTALEIGNEQVEYLSNKYSGFSNFKAVCSSFENYSCPKETYDLVFSATAFHWIKPEIGYPKSFELLKHNGTIAVFWHMYSIIRHKSAAFIEICKIIQRYAPELDTFISADEVESMHTQRLSEIQTNKLFDTPSYRNYRWNDEYTTEKYIELLNSYSDMHEVSEEKRNAIFKSVAEFIESRNGKIIVPQEVRLYMARKLC